MIKPGRRPDPQTDDETPEDQLWFLPGPPEDVAPTDLPWTVADRRPLFDSRDWLQAEASLARDLARAAAGFAALDERLRHAPEGLRQRLALREVTEIVWAMGARIPVERIALYELLRLSTVQDDIHDLSAASWALRRLNGNADPQPDLRSFLGRNPTGAEGFEPFAQHPMGDSFDALAGDWAAVQADLFSAHAITRAAAAYFSWRSFGLSGAGEILEAAIVAARIGAEDRRGGLRFLPVATGNIALYRAGGPAGDHLARWYRAVDHACLAALLHLDQLATWQAKATEVTRDLSGKTPPRLIKALAALPVLSVDMAARETGASKAAALRNLTEFQHRALVAEVTGQGRFRFWRAAF